MALEDPIVSLNRDPPTKSSYKELVATKIAAHYEHSLRQSAAQNTKMKYFNVSTIGLRGRHHSALSYMVTTQDVKLSRPHLKFLSGDFLTYKMKSEQSGGSPRCRICVSGSEKTTSHIISSCEALESKRKSFLLEFKSLLN